MTLRERTRRVMVGGVPIGGGAPITVQSMTNTRTGDAEATLDQIRRLADAGCALMRVAVNDDPALLAIPAIIAGSPVPIVADVHFDARMAVGAVEAGVAKLRINPGNLPVRDIARVAHAAKAHGVPIRVGANGGSLPKDLLAQHGATPTAMVLAVERQIGLLEAQGFTDIIVALKCSDAPRTVAAVRAFAERCDYPQHLGITESGLPDVGTIRSAVGIGALLLDGLGDTVRVSLTGDPIREAEAAYEILSAAGFERPGVEIISCPTCGRCGWDLESVARSVREATRAMRPARRIVAAVMGCVVNGPGEAREADLGVAGGEDGAVLFIRGQAPHKVPIEGLAQRMIDEIHRIAGVDGGA